MFQLLEVLFFMIEDLINSDPKKNFFILKLILSGYKNLTGLERLQYYSD
ncbi:hypothetical protein BC952_0715 [Flavobacterium limicola]|uniref:Uncharacterized protein n=1 Tax=Flavobacterium limicola TaxID=180441 RepID=A0A495S5F3_9FLAO|nr:hypothetical protein BC952_0715 [Flavobacterium limicola]